MRRLFAALLSFSVFSPTAVAATTIAGASGLTVTIKRTGTYIISAPISGWTFSGSIGYPLTNITTSFGSDGAGDYNEIDFDFQSDAQRHAGIRSYYNRMAALFTFTASAGNAPNTFSFPTFTRYPAGLSHVAFSGMFAHPTFGALRDDSPWIFFDESANAWVRHGKVIDNASSPEKEMVQRVEFPGLVDRFSIREEELEVSYIRSVRLEARLRDGRDVELAPREPGTNAASSLAVILSGEARDYAFALPEGVAPADVARSTLIVDGWYRRYSSLPLAEN